MQLNVGVSWSPLFPAFPVLAALCWFFLWGAKRSDGPFCVPGCEAMFFLERLIDRLPHLFLALDESLSTAPLRQALFLLFYALDQSCADRMTCNAAISACGLGSKWPRSLAVLDFMKGSPLALHPSVAACPSPASPQIPQSEKVAFI